MGGSSPVHSDCDLSRDVYLEFSFFDGVMVECADVKASDWKPLESKENNCKTKASPTGKIQSLIGREPPGRESAISCSDSLKGDRSEVRVPFAMCFSPSNLEDSEGETCLCTPLHPSVTGDGPFQVWSEKRSHRRDKNTHESLIEPQVSSFQSQGLVTKDLSRRKKVQFCSDEGMLSSGHQADSERRTCNKTSGPILKNSGGSRQARNWRQIPEQGKDLCCDSWQASSVENNGAEWNSLSPQSAYADSVTLENFNRKDCLLIGETGHGQVHGVDTRSSHWMMANGSVVDESRAKALFSNTSSSLRGEISSLSDRVDASCRQNWKDAENVEGISGLTVWDAAVGSNSPPCSSASMTDLAELGLDRRSPRSSMVSESVTTLASHQELPGAGVSHNKFCSECPNETSLDSGLMLEHFDSFRPAPKVSLNRLPVVGFSITKTLSKLDPKKLSMTDPAPNGRIHGFLHSTVRLGLPNYTFLLDNYEEVLTAKIWTDDMRIGKEQGTWQYSFYSLRGEGKRKSKTGWKHWRRKEKLASVLVGKMKVSSILCSDSSKDGKENMSVVSEFVLFGATPQESPTIAHADASSTTGVSALKMASPSRSEGNCTISSSSSGVSVKGPASLSIEHSVACSPEAISAWYVQQSLLPSSLAAPEIAMEGRKTSRKWRLQSGFSGIQQSKTRQKHGDSCSVISSNMDSNDSTSDVTWSPNHFHSELAAMIINVPFETQDRRALAEIPSRTLVDGAIHNHLENKNNAHHRGADITVILPYGHHSKPLCDSKGPSPLIRRWKDGGKCDCKGWDLGCGLVVFKNQKQELGIETKCNTNEGVKYKDKQIQGRQLALFKQDTDQEDPFISLTPQKSGLISLDFQAPLSPLQALAIAVAILHGREPGIPDEKIEQVVSTAHKVKDETQEKVFVDHRDPLAGDDMCGTFVSVEGEGTSDYVQLSKCLSQERSKLHDGLCNTKKRIQGSDALNCASELALSFERV